MNNISELNKNEVLFISGGGKIAGYILGGVGAVGGFAGSCWLLTRFCWSYGGGSFEYVGLGRTLECTVNYADYFLDGMVIGSFGVVLSSTVIGATVGYQIGKDI